METLAALFEGSGASGAEWACIGRFYRAELERPEKHIRPMKDNGHKLHFLCQK